VPPRRRGGQELPDNVQDRPEQNAGYDAAAHGGRDDEIRRRLIFADVVPEDIGADDELIPPAPGSSAASEIDSRAEREAAAEVRRRERTARISK
jgi:hypothetical protein